MCCNNVLLVLPYIVHSFSFKLFEEESRKSYLLRFIEICTNLRSKWLQLPYGDQGFFMWREIYKEIGGFPSQLFMEDYDFILTARSLGKVNVLNCPLLTSARRWINKGIISTTIFNQVLYYWIHINFYNYLFRKIVDHTK